MYHLIRESPELTLLYTTHKIEEAEALATDVIVMDKGKIVRQCPVAELSQNTNKQGELQIKVDGVKDKTRITECLYPMFFITKEHKKSITYR